MQTIKFSLILGLVISCKNFQSSILIDKHIKDRTAQKTYISRVVGEFPEGRIIVNKAIDCASRKIGLYWLDDIKGKESITEFERISCNGKTSVVKCYPKTGRTHQIRIHLQYLGHPIVNDPLYNQPTVWGKGNGKDGVYEYSKEQIEQNFLNIHTYEAWIIKQEQMDDNNNNNDVHEKDEEKELNKIKNDEINNREVESLNNPKDNQDVLTVNNLKRKIETLETNNIQKNEDEEDYNKKLKTEKSNDQNNDDFSKSKNVKEKPVFDESLLTKDDECFECKQKYRDPKRSDLTMYLHALSYKFDNLEFKTEMPKWAESDYAEEEEN